MEWRFQTYEGTTAMERVVARIVEEQGVLLITHPRRPEGITTRTYDLRPEPALPVSMTKVFLYVVMAITVFIVMASM